MSDTGSPFGHWPEQLPHILQYSGLMWSSCAMRIFWSASENGTDMAFRFSSSCSLSVMLGTVVATFLFFSTHFSAASIAPSRFRISVCLSPGFALRNPPAITFIATIPMPCFTAAAMSSSIFGSIVKL